MKLLPAFLPAVVALAQTWVAQPSETTASLRGVSAVDERVVWASGAGGTYLVTSNGGATWRAATVAGAEGLDFRDVQAVDQRTVYLLSIGPGDKSRIYKTADGGRHWDLKLTNPDPQGFFDALAFRDAKRGIALGDPVDGHFVVMTTDDGAERWQPQRTPPALEHEGAFAASGTCLIALGRRDAWFATGGPGGARVFHSRDGGRTWRVASTPVRNDGPSAGIFSLAFRDARHGVATGGDYNRDTELQHNVAVTPDGGRTWVQPAGAPPQGFRSAVAFVPDRKMWIATGTSGSDISYDNGTSWKRFDTGAYNAVSFISSRAGWAVGPKGRIARFRMEQDTAR